MITLPEELTEEIGQVIVDTCKRHGIVNERVQGDIIRATCDAIERMTVAPHVKKYLASISRR